MKRYVLVTGILVFCFLVSLNAQKPPMKWGRVNSEELNIKYSDYYSNMVVLCDYGTFRFDVNNQGNRLFVYNNRHKRIKVLTSDSLSMDTLRIKYQNLRKVLYYEGEVFIFKGQILLKSKKGKLKKEKIKNNTILYRELDDKYMEALIPIPKLPSGAILEYRYSIATLDIVNPDDWYFQDTVPVIWSEFRAQIPRNFSYELALYNAKDVDIYDEEPYTQSFSWTYDFRRENFNHGLAPAGYRNRVYKGTFAVNGSQYRFVRKNVPRIEKEPYTANIANYYEKLEIRLTRADKSVQWGFLAQDLYKAIDEGYELRNRGEKQTMISPSGYVMYKQPNLGNIGDKLDKSYNFGLPLKLTMGLRDTIIMLTEDQKTETEKMVSVYNHVRDRMHWNGYYSVFVREGLPKELIGLVQKTASLVSKNNKAKFVNISLRKPYKAKEGTSAEINLILINMLRTAGFNANPVLISTIENGLIDTSFYNLKRFNHVIAEVESDGKIYLLDAIHKGNPYFLLAKNDLNGVGLKVTQDYAEWIPISPAVPTGVVSNIQFSEEQYLQKVTIDEHYMGYWANDVVNRNISDNNFIRYTEPSENNTFSNSEVIINGQQVNIYNTINNIGSYVGQANNEISIKPLLNKSIVQNPFESPIRFYPVDFIHPFFISVNVQIPVKDGYRVKSLPEDKKILLGEKSAAYSLNAKLNDKNITLVYQFSINKSKFETNEYQDLRKFINMVMEAENQPVVLVEENDLTINNIE